MGRRPRELKVRIVPRSAEYADAIARRMGRDPEGTMEVTAIARRAARKWRAWAQRQKRLREDGGEPTPPPVEVPPSPTCEVVLEDS